MDPMYHHTIALSVLPMLGPAFVRARTWLRHRKDHHT